MRLLIFLTSLLLASCRREPGFDPRTVETDAGAAVVRQLLADCPHYTAERPLCLTIGPAQEQISPEFKARFPELKDHLLEHKEVTVTVLNNKQRVQQRSSTTTAGALVLLLQLAELKSAGGSYEATAAWSYKDDLRRRKYTATAQPDGRFVVTPGAVLEEKIAASEEPLHRYLYAATPDGAQPESGSGEGLLVFDIDAGFKLVRRITGLALSKGTRGLTGCAATHALYFSTTDQGLGCMDLETDKIVWEKHLAFGCDRSSVTLDGRKIFSPTGWWNHTETSGMMVVDGNTGQELRNLPVGIGAHNSIISLDGKNLYLGTETTLTVFDAQTEAVVKTIPNVGEAGVFPFTINHAQTLAYVCLGKHVGFDVVDLAAGQPIHRVLAGAEPIAHRTHGAALTPDETELWISDQEGKTLFIYDATQTPPLAKGSVPLSVGGHGWVNFSLDGNYVWTHTPDVFDAHSHQRIATLQDEQGKPFGSSKLIEVHLRGGKVVAVSSEFGLGRKL